jgi:hypothetical protein
MSNYAHPVTESISGKQGCEEAEYFNPLAVLERLKY